MYKIYTHANVYMCVNLSNRFIINIYSCVNLSTYFIWRDLLLCDVREVGYRR